MTTEAHPSRRDLERFMLGELPADSNRWVLRHLLSECERCHETTQLMWDVGSDLDEEEVRSRTPVEEENRFDYDLAIDRVFAKVRQANAHMEKERTTARDLYEELWSRPLDERRELVRFDLRFRSWGLCELLLNLAQEGRFTDAQEGEGLAEIAVAIAESLDTSTFSPALLQDLKARSWAFLGNAKRVLSDFRSAEHAFHVAESHLARGTGDRLEKARLFDLKASLRNFQGRSEDAVSLLNRAIAIYQRTQQKHLLGRALLNKGHVCIWSGELETAIALLRQGLALIDAGREARLVLTAQHNLAYVLNELGYHDEAQAMAARTRPRYSDLGDTLNLIRLRFLEGKIALAQNRLQEAEVALREVRTSFSEREMAYDAALAALDLAEVYARQARHAEVRELGREMMPIFGARDLQREAIAALIVFQKAAEAERVTVGLIHELVGRLHQLRREAPGGAAIDPLPM